jgi:hypothetical protein
LIAGGFAEEEEAFWFLPPILYPEKSILTNTAIYANFPVPFSQSLLDSKKDALVDYQIIYDPKDFLNLEGSQWSVFRKNIRKFPARNPGTLSYKRLGAEEHQKEVIQLLLQWSEGKELYDPETFSSFVLLGDNRYGLFLDEKLIGVNVFDENWKYINFRCCIDSGIPFLNEYLRWRFYTCEEVQQSEKQVNDGGVVGSVSLLNFKKKLNPKEVWLVHTSI